MSEITFLSEKQIFGKKKLEIFDKIGTQAAITDFSILLGGFVSQHFYTSEGNALKNRAGSWWTKSSDGDDDARVVDKDGDGDWGYVNKRNVGARPALPYSSIQSISSNGVRGTSGIKEIEYGEYPQTIVDENYSRELERAYNNGSLRTTGKNYTTDSVRYENTDTNFIARTHTEYEYNGSKYIRFVGDSNLGSILSDGRRIKIDRAYWVRVEPITWLVDERKNIALSKKLIFSGVQFKNHRNYNGDFDRTDIKQFMDNYFSKEIVQFKNQKELKNSEVKNDRVRVLLDEIKKYSEYYSDREGLKNNINKIINDYNSKLEEIKQNTSKGAVLMPYSPKELHLNLQVRLESILEQLKTLYTSNKSYHDILKYIDNCILALKGEKVENPDELINDLKNIKSVILPFLRDEKNREINDRLLSILESERNKISNYLNNFSIYNDNKTNKCDVEYKDVDEFINWFRRNIHSTLEALDELVKKRDIVNEIESNLINIAGNKYRESNNNYVKSQLNLINSIEQSIKILLGNTCSNYPKKCDEYEDRLNKIMSSDIDESLELSKIINSLNKKIVDLYKLNIEIQTFIDSIEEIDKYRI